MKIETPSFWLDDGMRSRLLFPASMIWRAGHRINMIMARPRRAPVPVLCIGGVVAGGSGKTPAVHAVLKLLTENGTFKKPAVLTRGYGGTLEGPVAVDSGSHDFAAAGDEALLHARRGMTVISKDRYEGALFAARAGGDIIVMDDGLQNFSLEKDMSILVVDGVQKFGNGRLIPAGPLREPVNDALARCDAVIQVGGERPVVTTTLPVFVADIVPSGDFDATLPYFGFAGLGFPEKFRRTLLDHGIDVTGFHPFPDHYPYAKDDIENLLAVANGRRLLTTEKDFVRIPEAYRKDVSVFAIDLRFRDSQSLSALIHARLCRT